MADAWENLVSGHLVSGKQAHDAHLVAVMNIHGVRRILTFNGADFGHYDSIEVIAPLFSSGVGAAELKTHRPPAGGPTQGNASSCL